jgi:FMN phosphatase YigB (HAD superfamily)
MTEEAPLVVLCNVDNTLLDNDRVRVELEAAFTEAVGAEACACFWRIYEEIRAATGVVDYPATIWQFGHETDEASRVRLRDIVFSFPFRTVVYPETHEALAWLRAQAVPVILSDGDAIYQAHKIHESGLDEEVEGRVLIYPHKEKSLDEVMARYPARQYAMVDDKPRIHAAMKAELGHRVTTIFVHQGKYAHEPAKQGLPAPDIALEHIGNLVGLEAAAIVAAGRGGSGS